MDLLVLLLLVAIVVFVSALDLCLVWLSCRLSSVELRVRGRMNEAVSDVPKLSMIEF